MGHLDAEPRTVGVAEAPEYPGRGTYQTYCGGLGGAERSHHRRVNIAHQAGRELRENGRQREQKGEPCLFAAGHAGRTPEFSEQYVLAFAHSLGIFRVKDTD